MNDSILERLDYFRKEILGEPVLIFHIEDKTKEVTKIIDKNLWRYNILGCYGGEEFIVILNYSNKEESDLVLERILNIVRKKLFIFNEKK